MLSQRREDGAVHRGIVFAAGEGTRLRPLTAERPKPMVPVGGQPILAYILTWLAENGVTDAAINLHYRPDAIQTYVGEGTQFGLRVHYSREAVLLGSAGALSPLRGFLSGGGAPFVAVYGDTLSTLPLEPLTTWHRHSGAVFTMAVMEHPRPTEAGIVELAEAQPFEGGVAGFVSRIQEKPLPHEVFSTTANAGIFVMSPRVLDYIRAEGASDIARDLIPTLLAAKERVAAWCIPASAVVWDVGTWESYSRAQREWPAIWRARRVAD